MFIDKLVICSLIVAVAIARGYWVAMSFSEAPTLGDSLKAACFPPPLLVTLALLIFVITLR